MLKLFSVRLRNVNSSFKLCCKCSKKAPIICGREPNAAEEERKLGVERSAELSANVNQVRGIFFGEKL